MPVFLSSSDLNSLAMASSQPRRSAELLKAFFTVTVSVKKTYSGRLNCSSINESGGSSTAGEIDTGGPDLGAVRRDPVTIFDGSMSLEISLLGPFALGTYSQCLASLGAILVPKDLPAVAVVEEGGRGGGE